MKVKSFDLIFSFWIFTWFIIYYLGFKKFNPLFALLIGLFVNLIILIGFLYFKNYYKAFLFVIVNTFIKIIPIYLLRKTKITKYDIYFTISLYIIYLIYIYLIDDKFNFVFKLDFLKKKEINTPISNYINNIIIYLKKKIFINYN